MDENRLNPFFASLPGQQLNSVPFSAAQLPGNQMAMQPIFQADLYRAAYERAKQDYELNRLFNPNFYEEGGGI